MKNILAIATFYFLSCNSSPSANESHSQSATDTALTEFISKIKAVDNHAHANSIDPNDRDFDALPLDGLGNIGLPVRVRPESTNWLTAAKAVYGFTSTELNEK